ncbi:hypothetical protein V8F06_007135 [Rhypophila decipiens]
MIRPLIRLSVSVARLRPVVRTVRTVSTSFSHPPQIQDYSQPLPKLGKDLVVRPVIDDPGMVVLDFQPGTIRTSRLWLRDVCRCPKCVDPHSGQKNFSTVDLPDDPKMRSTELLEDGSLKVVWENDHVFGEDVHESIYTRAEYEKWREESDKQNRQKERLPTQRKHWNKATYNALLENGVTKISYKDWTNTTDRAAFWRAFEALSQTGLIFLTGVPHGEQEVERIGNQIGMLQHTFYGKTWDVKSKPEAENVAYTSQFLGLHQDLMYHDPIPRLQLLHCLQNSCEGGESLFSDGLRAALQLRKADREAFDTLTKRAWFFGYDKAPHHYQQKHSVIEAGYDTYINCLHWAPPFQTHFGRGLFRTGPKSYSLLDLKRAASKFEKILSSEENTLEVKLNPGEAVIFDNWRVLHGRREFAAGSGGSRWLKGAYITHQVFKALDERRPRSENDTCRFPMPDSPALRRHLISEEMRQLDRDEQHPPKPEDVRLEPWHTPGDELQESDEGI